MNLKEPSTRPPRLLLDMSREFSFEASNGLCEPNGYLQRNGYVAMEVESGLHPDILSGFDALVLFHRRSPATYAPDQVRAVTEFVQRGGGLLLYGDGYGHSCAEAFPLNTVARQFGITFSTEKGSKPVMQAPGGADWDASLLSVTPSADATLIAADGAMRPVAMKIAGFNGPVVAISGSKLLSNPPNEPLLRNVPFVTSLFAELTKSRIGDSQRDVKAMRRTYPTRIDPVQCLTLGSFRVLYPDSVPVDRLQLFEEYLQQVYSLVAEQFGHHVHAEKTVIGLMTAGSGWTASPTLVGIGLLGSKFNVVSVLIHEFSNSLCVEAPIWLGDAGLSAYMQIRVKTALGGDFAASVAGEVDRRIADYQAWEMKNGPYDLLSQKNHHVGGGKVMQILRLLEERHGPDVLKQYFAAAKRLKGTPAVASRPIQDRVVHYFSAATGQDQVPFFATFDLHAARI